MKNWKKTTAVLLCAALVGTAGLTGCGKAQQPAPQQPQQQQQPAQQEAKTVAPMPSGLPLGDLKDATVNVAFSSADWKDGELTLHVYTEDLYDAVDVTTLKEGDTIVVNGKEYKVRTVEDKDGIQINGGLGESEDGVTMNPYEGGTYRPANFSDAVSYSYEGDVAFPVAENCKMNIQNLVEGKDGNELQTVTLEGADIADMLANAEEGQFNPNNTRVMMEAGKIVEINRVWTP